MGPNIAVVVIPVVVKAVIRVHVSVNVYVIVITVFVIVVVVGAVVVLVVVVGAVVVVIVLDIHHLVKDVFFPGLFLAYKGRFFSGQAQLRFGTPAQNQQRENGIKILFLVVPRTT